MKSIVIILLALMLSSCACYRACYHLRSLGCKEGYPMEDGTTCEKFCEQTSNNGHYMNVDKVCKIRTCDELMH